MASPISNFFDLPRESAPNDESKTSEKSMLDFLPMLSTAGLALDSDSEDDYALGLREDVDALAMACEPPPEAFPGVPTHVILRVMKIEGLPISPSTKKIPGQADLGFFLEEKNHLERSTASAAVLPDRKPPGRHRCAEPRATPKAEGEKWQAAWNKSAVGEVKVQLKGQDIVTVGILLGQEVVAVTAQLDLTGTVRRFFQKHELYRPGFSGTAVGMIPDATACIALELFPPGSRFPPRPLTGEEQMEFNLRELQAEPINDCRFCDGYGRRSCDGCGGHGILVCGTCDGMPALPCPICRGQGMVQDNLEGIGGPLSRRNDGEVLSTVRSRRCQNCWGAPLTCKACFGAAALRCSACNGAGWTVCTRCPKGGY